MDKIINNQDLQILEKAIEILSNSEENEDRYRWQRINSEKIDEMSNNHKTKSTLHNDIIKGENETVQIIEQAIEILLDNERSSRWFNINYKKAEELEKKIDHNKQVNIYSYNPIEGEIQLRNILQGNKDEFYVRYQIKSFLYSRDSMN